MRRKQDEAEHGRGVDDTHRLAIPRDEDLSLENTGSQTLRGVPVLEGSGSGYDPYDTVPNTTAVNGMQRLEDMRRLSEWIRMKRNLGRHADKDPEDD